MINQNLDKVQIAYIAGIIDGEGSISLYRQPSKTCTRGFRHRVSVVVTNTDYRLMTRLKTWFGGHVGKEQRLLNYRKQCYRWQLNAVNEQCTFLKTIEPFLLLKKKHAQLCLDFLENGGMGYRGTGITDEEFARRDKLSQAIYYLNQRGEGIIWLAAAQQAEETGFSNLGSGAPLQDENEILG